MTQTKTKYILYSSIFISIVILDQLTKFLTRKYLEIGESIRIFPFFNLTHVQNSGGGFGILKDNNLMFIIIYIVVAILIAYFFYNEKSNTQRIALTIFASGLVGNLIDRILFGQVTDFLDFIIWPVFNIADSALVISVLIMCWMIWKKR